ncbi:MAG: hypothetical protein ICV55_04940 [Coleofasciculus sp. C3-bin4]|nr:hypothetical protein [Coleofasciculus sp. C3-bin4]
MYSVGAIAFGQKISGDRCLLLMGVRSFILGELLKAAAQRSRSSEKKQRSLLGA